MQHLREHKALKAYFAFLSKKGASAEDLHQREAVLEQLDPYLNGIACHGSAYRQAVDALLAQVDKSASPKVLVIIREYYPFWLGDVKAIAALNQEHAFDVHLTQWQRFSGDLVALWERLDQERFATSNLWALNAYEATLKQKAFERTIIETRVKLAKLLLVQLKDKASPDAKDYRQATDAMLLAFENPALRHLFLLVVREFYYFWAGEPDAADYVKEAV